MEQLKYEELLGGFSGITKSELFALPDKYCLSSNDCYTFGEAFPYGLAFHGTRRGYAQKIEKEGLKKGFFNTVDNYTHFKNGKEFFISMMEIFYSTIISSSDANTLGNQKTPYGENLISQEAFHPAIVILRGKKRGYFQSGFAPISHRSIIPKDPHCLGLSCIERIIKLDQIEKIFALQRVNMEEIEQQIKSKFGGGFEIVGDGGEPFKFYIRSVALNMEEKFVNYLRKKYLK